MIKLPNIRGEYRHDFNIAPLTWFKVGGNAEALFKPADIDDLSYFLANLDTNIPIYTLGAGSNIIVRDGGVDGVVIKLAKGFVDITQKDHLITIGAGALNNSLAKYALQNSIAGFEFLVGIPGTIGGGIAMNAGSYGAEFKDILHSITMLDRAGQKRTLSAEDMHFGYRHNGLEEWMIFVEATFKTKSGNAESIKARMDQITTERQKTQPINQKTGGSTFANPDGYKAWQLIDQANLRGFMVGGAQFSPLHCNFMINTGNATATDLETLGEEASKRVLELTGIELKWEIKRIGK